jgi:hypothetical protein
VVNLSFDLIQINSDGSVTTRTTLTAAERDALEYARQSGVLIVAASGGTSGEMSALGEASLLFDNILTVGAAEGVERASYSSFGEGLGIVAPGSLNYPGGLAGTSIAAAQVTGIVSLVWAANPGLNYKQVIDILKATATDLEEPGWDRETGAGLVNAEAALALAQLTVAEARSPLPWVSESDIDAFEQALLERPASVTEYGWGYGESLELVCSVDDANRTTLPETYEEAFARGLEAFLSGQSFITPACSGTPLSATYRAIYDAVRTQAIGSGFSFGGGWDNGNWRGLEENTAGFPTLPDSSRPDSALLDPRYIIRVGATLGSTRDSLGATIDASFRASEFDSLSNTFRAVAIAVQEGDYALITEQGSEAAGHFYDTMHTVFGGLYDDVYDATTLGQLRAEATQLRDTVRGSQLPVKALHFDAVAVAATQWAAIIAHRSNEPLAERIRGVEFRAAILNLSQQYAQINPNSLPEDSPAFFLDTLWGATRSVDIKEDGAQELLQFLSGVPNPVQLLQFSTQLLKAVQGIPELEQDIRNPQFIRQLLELGKTYLTLNPIVVTPSSLDFFLNTLRPPATTGLSPDAYLNALNTRLQAGTPQLEQFFAAASTPEERLETLTLATNLLKATKITATGESGLFLQEHAREPEFLKEVVELGKTYIPLNPVGVAPQDFFLETLLNATTQTNITQGAEQFGTFIKGTAGIGQVDPTGLMEFSRSLLTVANQTSLDLEQVQNKEFFQELIGVGRTYLGLQPNTSDDNDSSPLNFYLDTLLKDQRKRVELKEEGASQQTLSQLKEQAITKAVSEFGEVIYGLEEPFGTNSPSQRAKVMELGQNLLELTARASEFEPQKTNPEFLHELLKLGKLYGTLQVIEPLPEAAPKSFLHQLWQSDTVSSEAIQQADDFVGALGASVSSTNVPLFALRLLIANEQRIFTTDTVLQQGNLPVQQSDLAISLARLAKAYSALDPDKGYGNSGSFLDTIWSASNDADALGNIAEIQDGALQLDRFLAGDQYSRGFNLEDQPRVLDFTTKLLKAANMTDQLAENQRTDPALLKSAFVDVSRNFAQIQLRNTEPNPGQTTFLHTLWNAGVEDTAAIRQGVTELENLLGEYGVSIESMGDLGKILLAIDLAVDKLTEDYPQVVQDMLRNILILLGIGLAVGALLKAPFAAAIAGFAALVGGVLDAFAVGFAGTETLTYLMEFYTQAINATDAGGINEAAITFVGVLKSGSEFVAAFVSLLTIGQAGWLEMEDALQSLLRLIKSIADRVGAILLTPVLVGLTTLFRLARNSVSAVIDLLHLLISRITTDLIVPVIENLVTIFQAITEFFRDQATTAFNNLFGLLRSAGDDFVTVLDFLMSFLGQAGVRNALMNPTKWDNLIEIARRLKIPEYASVKNALMAYPDAIGAILEFGPEAINVLAEHAVKMSRQGVQEDVDFTLQAWAKRLTKTSAQEGGETLEGLKYVLGIRNDPSIGSQIGRTRNIAYGSFWAELPNGSRIGAQRNSLTGVSRENTPRGTLSQPIYPRRLFPELLDEDITDPEVKILYNIAEQIENSGVTQTGSFSVNGIQYPIYGDVEGEIQLFTERKPCISCQNLILNEWEKVFPKVKIVKVLHGPRYLPSKPTDLNSEENFLNVLE